MKKLIVELSKAISSLFGFLEKRSERKKEKSAEKRIRRRIDRVNEARKSVAEGDADTLNRIIENRRQRKSASEAGNADLFLVFALMAFLCFIFATAGCITRERTIVVPADRLAVRTEMDGVKGWFVPDATMADLMETYVEAQKLGTKK